SGPWPAAQLQRPAVGGAPPPAAGHPSHAHAPAPAWTPRAIDSPAGVGPDADLPRGLDLRREEVPAPGGTASGGRWGRFSPTRRAIRAPRSPRRTPPRRPSSTRAGRGSSATRRGCRRRRRALRRRRGSGHDDAELGGRAGPAASRRRPPARTWRPVLVPCRSKAGRRTVALVVSVAAAGVHRADRLIMR